jgi:hypothetical protein
MKIPAGGASWAARSIHPVKPRTISLGRILVAFPKAITPATPRQPRRSNTVWSAAMMWNSS